MILSLDIGSKLGYYIEKHSHAYAVDLGKKDKRFFEFWNTLNKLLSLNKITQVVYEKAAFQKGHAIPIYHGMVGILKQCCILHSIPYTSIPVGTIKKCFTGQGRWDKEDCNIFNHEYELGLPKAKINKAPIMAVCTDLGITYDDDLAVKDLVSTGSLPGGLSGSTNYFMYTPSGALFGVATTPAASFIDITTDGTGDMTLTGFQDYYMFDTSFTMSGTTTIN